MEQISHSSSKSGSSMTTLDRHDAKTPLPDSLSDTHSYLLDVFHNCGDLSILPWQFGPEFRHAAITVFFDSLIQEQHRNYIKTLLKDLSAEIHESITDISLERVISFMESRGVLSEPALALHSLEAVVSHIVEGNFVVILDQWNKAYSFPTLSTESRQVTEPASESVVQGPREGTVENLQKNLGLLRMRMRNPNFKVEYRSAGRELNTRFACGYLHNVVSETVLASFRQRLERVQDKEILETSFIEQLLEENSYSPFPQFRYTERTDVAAAALLDGKIIVMVQGSSSILICPGLFMELLQSSEDYYQRTVIASLIRLMRVVAFIIALTLPSIYIALSTFHSELIPTVLLLAVIDSREGIPFPAFIEALIMEFFFELLREAGIRLPKPVGSAVSIVGALVIGDAAINAGIASPIMVVAVAITGISSFALPQYNVATALRILRFPLMIASATLGGFGLTFGLLFILLHLSSLKSLGVPYLGSFGPLKPKELLDVFIRAPLQVLFRLPRGKRLHDGKV